MAMGAASCYIDLLLSFLLCNVITSTLSSQQLPSECLRMLFTCVYYVNLTLILHHLSPLSPRIFVEGHSTSLSSMPVHLDRHYDIQISDRMQSIPTFELPGFDEHGYAECFVHHVLSLLRTKLVIPILRLQESPFVSAITRHCILSSVLGCVLSSKSRLALSSMNLAIGTFDFVIRTNIHLFIRLQFDIN